MSSSDPRPVPLSSSGGPSGAARNEQGAAENQPGAAGNLPGAAGNLPGAAGNLPGAEGNPARAQENPDAIHALDDPDHRENQNAGAPAPQGAQGALPPTRQPRQCGRLQKIWVDICCSEKSASAVTILTTYGYIISFIMTFCGLFKYEEFGQSWVIRTKLVFQVIGFGASAAGITGCYSKGRTHWLSLFFVHQLMQTIALFFTASYMFGSRELLFHEFVTEPFYNMKLVDYPFVNADYKIDMAAEPAYEVSLLCYRAQYMTFITIIFNVYGLYAVGRRLACPTSCSNNRRRRDEAAEQQCTFCGIFLKLLGAEAPSAAPRRDV